MGELKFDFADAVFTYFLADKANDRFEHSLEFSSGLHLSYTRNTDVIVVEHQQKKLCILGLCIDAYRELKREEIAGHLLRSCHGIAELLAFFGRLAGQYIVLYQDGANTFVFGDATGRVQINYSADPARVALASNDKVLAEHLGCEISARALEIRQASEYSQPFPGDITLYDEIKVLLPNHYLELGTGRVSRFFPDRKASPERNLRGAAALKCIERSIELARNILREYASSYELLCPLSGGWDSRLNLAFAQECDPEVECYTFKHPRFTDTTGDYFIPPKVCSAQGLRHRSLPDLQPPEEYLQAIESAIGPYHSNYTLSLAYTLRSAYSSKAILDGGIIDQVGKSLLGNSLPEFYGRASFFQAKLHNFSAETRNVIQGYLDALGTRKDVYDLFAIESRCGRWGAQGVMIYSTASILSLNIFNCREIIELWMRVSRKQRTEKLIHKRAFAMLNPSLLDVEFNPDDRTGVFKKHYLSFLAMTYAKQLAGWMKHKLR